MLDKEDLAYVTSHLSFWDKLDNDEKNFLL